MGKVNNLCRSRILQLAGAKKKKKLPLLHVEFNIVILALFNITFAVVTYMFNSKLIISALC